MSTATSTLNLTVNVNQVPFERTLDTRVNIRKRREQITYQTITNSNQVNISYVAAPPVVPDINLHITDKSTSVPANRPQSSEDVSLFTGSTTTAATSDILITDTFTTAANTIITKPLFFVHDLNSENFPNDSADTIISIIILDSSFTEVLVRDVKYDSTNRKVFSNIAHSYDSVTGLATVFYVKYTVKLSSPAGQLNTYIEILDNKPIFNEAGFDDINEYGLLEPENKAYLIEESAGQFNITLPASDDYALQQIVDSKIVLTQPPVNTLDEQWFVSATNGTFLASRLVGNPESSVSYRYRIAEFAGQTFKPVFPFKELLQTETVTINNHLIHLNKSPVEVSNELDTHILIYIKDSEENLKAAVSTSSADHDTKAGIDIDGNDVLFTGGILRDDEDIRHMSVGIRSVDTTAGFVDILNILLLDDVITATYFYTETSLELTSFDFNPVFNRDILDQRVSWYVKPELAATLSQTVFYLIVDDHGRVIDSDDTTSTISGVNIQDIIEDRKLYYETIPSAGVIPAPPGGSLSFQHSLSTEQISGITNASQYLILGDVTVGESNDIGDLALFDVRQRGGGLKSSLLDTRINTLETPQWYYDVARWDGQVYPGTGAFHVEIPYDRLTDFNGSLTRQQVQDITLRHAAAGHYAAIRYYGIDPTITLIDPTRSGINLEWTQHRPTTKFGVYYGLTSDGPWTLSTDGYEVNDPTGNSHIIPSLDSGVLYYCYVQAQDGENEPAGQSPMVRVKTLVV